MKLIINNEQNNSHIDDTYTLSTDMLKFKATHMFIASHRWDSISIELSDNLNEEDVKYLPKASENVYCRLPSTINEKMLSLLCSVYQDKAGQLRLNYMLQKDITIFLPKEAE